MKNLHQDKQPIIKEIRIMNIFRQCLLEFIGCAVLLGAAVYVLSLITPSC
jgi:hypothetical protein